MGDISHADRVFIWRAYSMRSTLVPVLRPFLDLVVIAIVRQQRLVGLSVGPIAHDSGGGHRSRMRMFWRRV